MRQFSNSDGPAGLLVLGKDGAIVAAPDFFRRHLQIERRDFPTSIFHLFDPRDPPFLKLFRIYRHAYGATEYHLRVQGPFGSRHQYRYWPVELEGSKSLGATGFFVVDDSAHHQTHDWEFRRLRRSILNDVQESLSDYFKNRLATLQLLTETLRDAPELAAESAPRMARAVDELKIALNQVITGIADVETTSDYQDSPVRIADLAPVIETWGTPRTNVSCYLQDVAPSTLISAALVERILLPIVENALDASNPGDTVEVTIAEVDEGFAHIQIADCGEGMSERIQQRARDPFFTTRTGQLGLGLAHAQEALREAGGEWTVSSTAREGTTVTVLLPITTAARLFR